MRKAFDMDEALANPNYPLSAGREIKKLTQYDLDYQLPSVGRDAAHLAYRKGDPEWAAVQADQHDWIQVCSIHTGGRLCFWSFMIYFNETGMLTEVRLSGRDSMQSIIEVPDVFAQLADCRTIEQVESMLRSYGVTSEESE